MQLDIQWEDYLQILHEKNQAVNNLNELNQQEANNELPGIVESVPNQENNYDYP